MATSPTGQGEPSMCKGPEVGEEDQEPSLVTAQG